MDGGCEGVVEGTAVNDVPEEAILYFPPVEREDDEALEAALGLVRELAKQWFGIEEVPIEGSLLGEQDWGAAWRAFYHATESAPGLWVGPPEEKEPTLKERPNNVYIAIEYAPAFGTGGHPTTRGCLRMLQAKAGEYDSILDVGTGTGVLCIAAILLGAEEAVGMDCEEASARSFASSATINGVGNRLVFVQGSTIDEAVMGCLLNGVPIPDLVVCNMLSASFDSMLEPLARLRKPMIVSGFLVAEEETLKTRLANTGWDVAEVSALEEWGTWYCLPRVNG